MLERKQQRSSMHRAQKQCSGLGKVESNSILFGADFIPCDGNAVYQKNPFIINERFSDLVVQIKITGQD